LRASASTKEAEKVPPGLWWRAVASEAGAARGAPPPPEAGPLLAQNPHASRIDQPTHRRAGVLRRAARREISRLREPERLAAIALLAIAGGLVLAFLAARGELAGADARAYWAGVRIWLAGGDPYHPSGPFLPYVYAPWLLPVFLPWALLPWNVAWFAWRGMNVILLLLSIDWAYRRRPLRTAMVVALLAFPITVTLDTGNVTLLLAMAVWAAQFTGPRLGGALWALAASMKWFPALLFIFLPPRARLWGLAAGVLAIVFSLLTWPQTLVQIDTVVNFPRPLRIDYVLLLWGTVPWFWRHPRPLGDLKRHGLREMGGAIRNAVAGARGRWRGDDGARAARHGMAARARAFFGLG
jgi:hypothetical protein